MADGQPGVNFTNILCAVFGARISPKWKKTLITWLSFCAFGIWVRKSCANILVKLYSISPTFYVQFFGTKVFFTAWHFLSYWNWQKSFSLVTLTTWENFTNMYKQPLFWAQFHQHFCFSRLLSQVAICISVHCKSLTVVAQTSNLKPLWLYYNESRLMASISDRQSLITLTEWNQQQMKFTHQSLVKVIIVEYAIHCCKLMGKQHVATWHFHVKSKRLLFHTKAVLKSEWEWQLTSSEATKACSIENVKNTNIGKYYIQKIEKVWLEK